MNNVPWVIGLTGTNGAGKGTVAAALEGWGFAHYSLSDILREELKTRGGEETVDALTRLGNQLRAKHGGDVLARRVMDRIQEAGISRAIADSVRSVPEVRFLRSAGPFLLVAVDAPVDLRYERVMARNRPGDRVSLDQFISQEDRQLQGGDAEQNLLACMEMADILLTNAGTQQDLVARLEGELRERRAPLELEAEPEE